MTYAADIASRRHRVGYYLSFDGVVPRIATHDMAALAVPLSGTYLPAMTEPPQGGPQTLDRERGLVLPAGFAVRVMDTDTVRAMLRKRGGTLDSIITAIAKTTALTTIALASGSATYAVDDLVYLDQETLKVQSDLGGGSLQCFRGQHGSIPAAHVAGAVTSSVPRHWLDRRATLYAVNLDTGSEQALRTGFLDRSPRFVGGQWELEFTDAMRLLNRPLLTGWATIAAKAAVTFFSELVNGAAATLARIPVEDVQQFKTNATSGAFVLVEAGGKQNVYRLRSGFVDFSGSGAVDLVWGLDLVIYDQPISREEIEGSTDVTLRQVEIVTGRPGQVALQVMLSINGDLANDPNYDILPGRDPTSSGSDKDYIRKRTGAGLPAAWVDIAAWQGAGDNRQIFALLDERVSLAEFLAQEILWRLGGFAYVTPDGKVSFAEYEGEATPSALPLLDESSILQASVQSVDDESEILTSAAWDCNYLPGAGFRFRSEAIWNDVVGTYGDRSQTLEFKSKSLWVGANPPGQIATPAISQTQLVGRLDRMHARTRNGVRRVSLLLPWDQQAIGVASRFRLSDDRIPDHLGGTGQSAQPYEVTSVNQDYAAGTIEIQADELPRSWLIAPAAYLLSSVGSTITLSTTGENADLFDALPADDFIVGCTVRFYNASASPPFSQSVTAVVLAAGTATIVLTASAPSFPGPDPLAAGDLVVLEDSADTGNVNTTGADVRDHLFLVDAAGLISGRAGTRWQ